MRRLTHLFMAISLSILVLACDSSGAPDDTGTPAAPSAESVTPSPEGTGQEESAESEEGVGQGFANPDKEPVISETRPPAPDWLADLAETQISAAGDIEAFHDFRFTDMQPESGITFRNRVVPDPVPRTRKQPLRPRERHCRWRTSTWMGLTDLYFDLTTSAPTSCGATWVMEPSSSSRIPA